MVVGAGVLVVERGTIVDVGGADELTFGAAKNLQAVIFSTQANAYKLLKGLGQQQVQHTITYHMHNKATSRKQWSPHLACLLVECWLLGMVSRGRGCIV